MIKKIFSNKIYFLVSLLGLLILLTIIASVAPSKNKNAISNLNPFASNNNNNSSSNNLDAIEDPVLKFFLDQNSKLKSEMNLVNNIDQDIPYPQITWKVDFK